MNMRIIGSGSFIPEVRITNQHFINHTFLDDKGKVLHHSIEDIIQKFATITGIKERRYAPPHFVTSDIAYLAARKAIDTAGIDAESIDYIIVAHNFGDVPFGKTQSDMVPSLASRVKNKLGIKNPKCVPYDIIFGCPGWIEASIQAGALIKSGMAKRCLVIGAECLSRIVDPHDRDTMIYADGAGATIFEYSENGTGMLAYANSSHSGKELDYLHFGQSYNNSLTSDTCYIKMSGRKVYEFAITEVPRAMKECLDTTGLGIDQVKKILIHQANEKMDEAIVKRFYGLYDRAVPQDVMPMIIEKLGNSSVATIPILYDLLVKNELEGHKIGKDDIILFASVGAGMNINAMVYKV